MQTKIKKYSLPFLLFALAGFLWAWEIDRGTNNGDLENPFSFVLGALYFGALGSLALVWFFEISRLKQVLKIVGLGTLGWIIAWILPLAIDYWLFLFSVHILDFVPMEKLGLGIFWLEFLFFGGLLGLGNAFLFNKKLKWNLVWKVGLGFVIASLIGSIFANIFIAFTIIGIIFGVSILWTL